MMSNDGVLSENILYIGNLNKSELLYKLWKSAKPPSPGSSYYLFELPWYKLPKNQVMLEIGGILNRICKEVDSIYGRDIRINFATDYIDVSRYDECNGERKAKEIIEKMRKK